MRQAVSTQLFRIEDEETVWVAAVRQHREAATNKH